MENAFVDVLLMLLVLFVGLIYYELRHYVTYNLGCIVLQNNEKLRTHEKLNV